MTHMTAFAVAPPLFAASSMLARAGDATYVARPSARVAARSRATVAPIRTAVATAGAPAPSAAARNAREPPRKPLQPPQPPPVAPPRRVRPWAVPLGRTPRATAMQAVRQYQRLLVSPEGREVDPDIVVYFSQDSGLASDVYRTVG
jgi:hypothetical protein